MNPHPHAFANVRDLKPRDVAPNNNAKPLSLRLPDDERARLLDIATEIGCSVSELLRWCVRRGIADATRELENP